MTEMFSLKRKNEITNTPSFRISHKRLDLGNSDQCPPNLNPVAKRTQKERKSIFPTKAESEMEVLMMKLQKRVESEMEVLMMKLQKNAEFGMEVLMKKLQKRVESEMEVLMMKLPKNAEFEMDVLMVKLQKNADSSAGMHVVMVFSFFGVSVTGDG
jgi:hypothetical protein